MTTEPVLDAGIEARAFADRVDGVLDAFLQGCAQDMEAAAEGGRTMVDEIRRLVHGGRETAATRLLLLGVPSRGRARRRADHPSVRRHGAVAHDGAGA